MNLSSFQRISYPRIRVKSFRFNEFISLCKQQLQKPRAITKTSALDGLGMLSIYPLGSALIVFASSQVKDALQGFHDVRGHSLFFERKRKALTKH